jgi:hypothetical protein
MEIKEEILRAVEAEGREPLRQLLEGPEELRLLVERYYKHREEGVPGTLFEDLRKLRPLTRRYIVRVFESSPYTLQDNEWTRSLGFFGDWKA